MADTRPSYLKTFATRWMNLADVICQGFLGTKGSCIIPVLKDISFKSFYGES